MKSLQFFLLAGLIGLTSCESGQQIPGCTDSDSRLWDRNATVDDGSCLYWARYTCWFDQTTSQNFINDGITSISVSTDDTMAGTSRSNFPTTEYKLAPPLLCYDGSYIWAFAWGPSPTTVAKQLEEKDQAGNVIWDTTFVVGTYDCAQIKITY